MPTYEYQCQQCGNVFELRRRLAARDEAAPCPSCASIKTSRNWIQRFGVLNGVRPNAGESESEDFDDPFNMSENAQEYRQDHPHEGAPIVTDSAMRYGPNY